jgi:hypothetical protein
MKNLAHRASFDSEDKDAPSKPGIKHLAGRENQAAAPPRSAPGLSLPAPDEGRREAGDGLAFSGVNRRMHGASHRGVKKQREPTMANAQTWRSPARKSHRCSKD